MGDDDAGYRDNIALIGFMGAGKSAVGLLLSRKLGMDCIDLDEVIEDAAGESVREIFAHEGEKGFRERESDALRNVVDEGKGLVLSCGGGIVLGDENIALLRGRCRVFFLRISAARAVERLAGAADRPLLEGGDLEERVRGLMEERAHRYLLAAHEVIDADEKSPQEIAEDIAERWSKSKSGRQARNIPFS